MAEPSGAVLAELTAGCVRAGSFASVQESTDVITAYLAERNENPRPYQWKARRKEILEKIHRAREALAEAHGQLMPFEAQDARGGLLASSNTVE